MKRLTTNDTNHIFAVLNLFYAEDNEVMVRGGGPEPDYADTTLVELIRRIANTHNLTIEAEDAESLGDEMYDAMFDGVDTVEGVVGLLHAAAVQAAEMRGRLEMIEDILGGDYNLDRLRELAEADRKGRCVVLPHMIGDTLISGLAKTPINAKPNERANQAQELEELYTRLYAVTGFTAEKLLEMFAAGYMLKKPDYSKLREEMANLAETTTPNELPKRH